MDSLCRRPDRAGQRRAGAAASRPRFSCGETATAEDDAPRDLPRIDEAKAAVRRRLECAPISAAKRLSASCHAGAQSAARQVQRQSLHTRLWAGERFL